MQNECISCFELVRTVFGFSGTSCWSVNRHFTSEIGISDLQSSKIEVSSLLMNTQTPTDHRNRSSSTVNNVKQHFTCLHYPWVFNGHVYVCCINMCVSCFIKMWCCSLISVMTKETRRTTHWSARALRNMLKVSNKWFKEISSFIVCQNVLVIVTMTVTTVWWLSHVMFRQLSS